MTNWTDIHPDFTEELQKEWEDKGLSYEECKEWIDIGLIINDAEYVHWLKEIKKVDNDWVHNYGNDEELRNQYREYSISRWRSKKFTDEEIESWRNAGLRTQDGGYAAWMRDILKMTSDEYLDHLKEGGDKLLREQHQKFLEEIRAGRKVAENSRSQKINKELQPEQEQQKKGQAQKWLDREYPLNLREKIRELDISGRNLKGALKLEKFFSLEKITCYSNEITNLDLSQCENLEELHISLNNLTSTDFLSIIPYPEKLIWLNISNNDFASQNLDFLKPFVNLKLLFISNNAEDRIKRNIYNRFYGSLEPLKNFKQLGALGIIGTDIDSGLEYLPEDSLEILCCSSEERPESKVKKLEEQLEPFLVDSNGKYDIKAWKGQPFIKKPQFFPAVFRILQEKYSEIKEMKLYADKAYKRKINFLKKQPIKVTNIKKWLDDFPLEKRKDLTELNISHENLEGILKMKNFSNLRELDFSNNHITNLEVINCPSLARLDCSMNSLVELKVTNCRNITKLDCSNNSLTELDFNSLNSEKLIYLDISNNHFSSWNLYFLSPFINLEEIYIGSDQVWSAIIGVRNELSGSLEPLRNMKKLKYLDISGTDIKAGLEYLPDSLEKFVYSHYEIEEAQVKKIHDDLQIYDDIQSWRQAQPAFRLLKENLEKVNSKLSINELLKNAFFNVRTGTFEGDLQSLTSLLKVNNLFIEEKEREINFLELRIQELINLIKKQKEKIVEAFLRFAPEEELLRELITTHLELAKLKKQRSPVTEQRKTFNSLRDKLEDKLNVELMEEVEAILDDCRELINWEWELEEKINAKLLLQKEQRLIPQITITNNQGNIYFGSLQIEDNSNFVYDKRPFQESTEQSLVRWRTSENLQKELARIQIWKERRTDDIKEKNAEIAELEEQIKELKRRKIEEPSTGLTKEIKELKIREIVEQGLQKDLAQRTKRRLSLYSQANTVREKTKLVKINEEEYYFEPMEIDSNWTILHPHFTPQLIKLWQSYNFTPAQARDWININSPTDQVQSLQEPEFYAWLRDIKQVNSDWIHNYGDMKQLRQEYQKYLQEQLETHIEVLPRQN